MILKDCMHGDNLGQFLLLFFAPPFPPPPPKKNTLATARTPGYGSAIDLVHTL